MSPTDQSNERELTVIATTSGMLRAEVLKSKLENAGIPVILDYEAAGHVIGITAPGLSLSRVRILVAREDASEAHRLLTTPPPEGWEEEAAQSEQDPEC
jgi:hypothetical protein